MSAKREKSPPLRRQGQPAPSAVVRPTASGPGGPGGSTSQSRGRSPPRFMKHTTSSLKRDKSAERRDRSMDMSGQSVQRGQSSVSAMSVVSVGQGSALNDPGEGGVVRYVVTDRGRKSTAKSPAHQSHLSMALLPSASKEFDPPRKLISRSNVSVESSANHVGGGGSEQSEKFTRTHSAPTQGILPPGKGRKHYDPQPENVQKKIEQRSPRPEVRHTPDVWAVLKASTANSPIEFPKRFQRSQSSPSTSNMALLVAMGTTLATRGIKVKELHSKGEQTTVEVPVSVRRPMGPPQNDIFQRGGDSRGVSVEPRPGGGGSSQPQSPSRGNGLRCGSERRIVTAVKEVLHPTSLPPQERFGRRVAIPPFEQTPISPWRPKAGRKHVSAGRNFTPRDTEPVWYEEPKGKNTASGATNDDVGGGNRSRNVSTSSSGRHFGKTQFATKNTHNNIFK